jgi:hypothetical protein
VSRDFWGDRPNCLSVEKFVVCDRYYARVLAKDKAALILTLV